MDIIKEPSEKVRIHFFRNTNHPEWYFVKQFADWRAVNFYVCSHHLPPLEESAYPDLPVEWAFAIELGKANADKYLEFIRNVKGIRHNNSEIKEDLFIGVNGWYEFEDIKNTDKWLNEFYEFQKHRWEELPKANGNGTQISLF